MYVLSFFEEAEEGIVIHKVWNFMSNVDIEATTIISLMCSKQHKTDTIYIGCGDGTLPIDFFSFSKARAI